MRRLIRALALAGVTLSIIGLLAPAATASTYKFYSRNNYAIASGKFFYCDSASRSTCLAVVGLDVSLTLRDTPQRPSTSYAYLTYRNTDHVSRRVLLATARNGRTVKVHRFVSGALPSGAKVTVCTKRGSGWYCGNPSGA
jgi:hypothetical protein